MKGVLRVATSITSKREDISAGQQDVSPTRLHVRLHLQHVGTEFVICTFVNYIKKTPGVGADLLERYKTTDNNTGQ